MRRKLGLSISRSASPAEKAAYNRARHELLKQDPAWVAAHAASEARRIAAYKAVHPVYNRTAKREWANRATAQLSDSYVRQVLVESDPRLRRGPLPPELIELKRELLGRRRLLKEYWLAITEKEKPNGN